MPRQPVPFEKCLFVCENTRDGGRTCCGAVGTALREALRNYVKTHGLQNRVRIVKSGCLDRCAAGPNIFVTPDHVWYSAVTPDDLQTLIAEQLAPMTKPHPV
ncbi:MAG: (2Fe-2S) ferredoxin domain-containing protein [Deltaproteobacteria bacterium]|nr:(2Fe-2S) ferredoxin domain-containing protein [Deltaproteobacteria bacterium]